MVERRSHSARSSARSTSSGPGFHASAWVRPTRLGAGVPAWTARSERNSLPVPQAARQRRGEREHHHQREREARDQPHQRARDGAASPSASHSRANTGPAMNTAGKMRSAVATPSSAPATPSRRRSSAQAAPEHAGEPDLAQERASGPGEAGAEHEEEAGQRVEQREASEAAADRDERRDQQQRIEQRQEQDAGAAAGRDQTRERAADERPGRRRVVAVVAQDAGVLRSQRLSEPGDVAREVVPARVAEARAHRRAGEHQLVRRHQLVGEEIARLGRSRARRTSPSRRAAWRRRGRRSRARRRTSSPGSSARRRGSERTSARRERRRS